MSGDEKQLEPLLLQKKAWSERDLLEHIVDRHFKRLSDSIGDFPGWQVSPLEGSASDSVIKLDEHLRSHGWRAFLDVGEPYHLSLLDLSEDINLEQTPFIQFIIWSFAMLFSLVLGTRWIAYQNEGVNWFDAAILQQSFLYFALPLVATLFFTSVIRTRVFHHLGVGIGHFLPAISPIMFFSKSVILWPFGLLALMNQKFMKTATWINRRGMLISGLVMPISFIAIGFIFSVIGIFLTPNESPDFVGMPAIIQLNTLTNFVASFIIPSEEIVARTVWLHPLALAGQALMTFGWILLLPIPGFPGYRFLWAIVGSEKMTESNTEYLLYGFFLMGVVVVLITSGFTPWIFLFALGVWRMFSEQSVMAAGLIVDNTTELENNFRFRAFVAVSFTLFLTFPGLATVVGYDDWEAGLELDWADEQTISLDEEWSHDLEFEMIGVSLRFVQVSVWADPPRVDWNLTIDCGNGAVALPVQCDVGDVDLLNKKVATVSSMIANNSSEILPTTIHFIVDADSQRSIKSIKLNPDAAVSPIQSDWRLEPTFDGLLACTNLTFSGKQLSGNFSTSALLWSVSSPVDGLFTTESEPEICLSGPNYGRMVLDSDQYGQLLPLEFVSDEGQSSEWPIRLQNPISTMPIPNGGWILDGKLEHTPAWLANGSHVAWGEGLETCSKVAIREPNMIDDEYTWMTEIDSEIRIPDVDGDFTMPLDLPIGGVIAACDSSLTPPQQANYTTAAGPALALKFGGEITWSWVDMPLQSGLWELVNLGNDSITIVTMSHHSLDDNLTGWEGAEGVTVPVGGSVQLNLTQLFNPTEVMQTAWLSLDEESGITNSIRLNIASWCMVGTDLDPSDENVQCVLGA